MPHQHPQTGGLSGRGQVPGDVGQEAEGWAAAQQNWVLGHGGKAPSVSEGPGRWNLCRAEGFDLTRAAYALSSSSSHCQYNFLED
eukprot:810664-Rhodomonas_salina.3